MYIQTEAAAVILFVPTGLALGLSHEKNGQKSHLVSGELMLLKRHLLTTNGTE